VAIKKGGQGRNKKKKAHGGKKKGMLKFIVQKGQALGKGAATPADALEKLRTLEHAGKTG